MNTYIGHNLRASSAVDYLACAGIVRLLEPEGATLRFEEGVPVIEVDFDEATFADLLVRRLTAYLSTVRNSIPLRSREIYPSQIVEFAAESWQSHDPTFGLRIEEIAGKGKLALGTRFVVANNVGLQASLARVENHVKKSSESHLTSIISTLFDADRDREVYVSADSLMGFSIGDILSQERYSNEYRFLDEASEILAACAVAEMSPRASYSDRRGWRWLRWHLNIAPATWSGLLALQRRESIPGLVTYESQFRSGDQAAGLGNAFRFTVPVNLNEG